MRAVNRISGMIYKAEAVNAGLQALGYSIVNEIPHPTPADVLCLWNRTIRDEELARKFEQAGATVLIFENGYLGKSYCGHRWFAISDGHHNGLGWIPELGSARRIRYMEHLGDWQDGTEIVALPQRGIGESGVAMPRDYVFPSFCRVRRHPGTANCIPLEHDLANAKAVVTWGSGAAIKALSMGVPCFHAFPFWIAASASTHVSIADYDNPPRPDRLSAFDRIFNGMWTQSEVESGEALCHYLSR